MDDVKNHTPYRSGEGRGIKSITNDKVALNEPRRDDHEKNT